MRGERTEQEYRGSEVGRTGTGGSSPGVDSPKEGTPPRKEWAMRLAQDSQVVPGRERGGMGTWRPDWRKMGGWGGCGLFSISATQFKKARRRGGVHRGGRMVPRAFKPAGQGQDSSIARAQR